MAQAQTVPALMPPPEVAQSKTSLEALKEIDALVARAQSVQVTNADEYAMAVQICSRISGVLKKNEEERLGITRKMDAAKKAVMDFFNGKAAPLQAVDAVIRGKLRSYDAEQKRIADEARRKAEAEAQRQRDELARKAREEQAKADAKARAEREEAERQRQEQARAERIAREQRQAAEAAQRAADEAKRQGDEKAAREAAESAERAAKAARESAAAASAAATAATKAEQKAETITARADQKVEGLQQQAASVVAALVPTDRTKVKGKSDRTIWKWKLLDASKLSRLFLMPDETKISAQVKALKKDAVELIGTGAIEVWEEADLSIKADKS